MPIETRDWIDFFPSTHEGVRPLQEKAINSSLNRLQEGVETVLLEAPTGVGKSYIAWLIARYFAIEYRWKTRLVVPNTFLEDQYIADFASFGLKQLHSASHYHCEDWRSCDIGRGAEIVRQQPFPAQAHPDLVAPSTATSAATPAIAVAVRSSVKCKRQESRPYVKARGEFQTAPIAVTNTKYALTCARFGHDFVTADLTIFDEAHNLNSAICGMYDFTIPFRLVDGEIPTRGEEFAWLRDVFRPNTEALLEAANEQLECAESATIAKDAEIEIDRLTTLLSSVDTLLSCAPRDWVITRNPNSLRFQPIWAHKIAPTLLGFLSKRRILMSSTFLDQTVHLQMLGL
jgi:Rad3-related DNA helicase